MSNKSSRHTLIGIPDKHKLLPLCELASSMLAVALDGFIFCQQVHTQGFCSFVCFAVCFIRSFIKSSEIEFKFGGVAGTALQQ